MSQVNAPPAGAGRRGRVPLVGVMALVLMLELVTNRVAARMVHVDLMWPREVQRAIDLAGAFFFHLASLMAVLLVAFGLLRLLSRPTPLAPPTPFSRGMTVITVMGFSSLVALSLWLRLPDRLVVYMLLLFTMLGALLVRLAWRSLEGRWPARAWMMGFAAAMAAHLVWVGAVHLQLENQGAAARVALTVGEALMVVLAATAPFALVGRGARWAGPFLLGSACVGAVLGAALMDWPFAARVAVYGFGIELPMPTALVVVFAVAFGLMVGAVVALLAQPGTWRLRGWGLLLLLLSGYQMELPYQLASTVLGLLCIADSFARERLDWMEPER